MGGLFFRSGITILTLGTVADFKGRVVLTAAEQASAKMLHSIMFNFTQAKKPITGFSDTLGCQINHSDLKVYFAMSRVVGS